MKKILSLFVFTTVLLSFMGCKQGAADFVDFRGNYENVVAAYTSESESDNSENGTFKDYFSTSDVFDDYTPIEDEDETINYEIHISLLVANEGTYTGDPFNGPDVTIIYKKMVDVDLVEESVWKKINDIEKKLKNLNTDNDKIKYIKKYGKKNEDGIYIFNINTKPSDAKYFTCDEDTHYPGTVDLNNATLSIANEFTSKQQTFNLIYPEY